MFRERYGKKYGNSSHVYNGLSYHSKKEAGYAAELDLRLRANDISGWQRQIKISLDVEGRHITNYYVDFCIIHKDKTMEFIEVKGFETPEWKIKWRLFEALHERIYPGSRLTVVK